MLGNAKNRDSETTGKSARAGDRTAGFSNDVSASPPMGRGCATVPVAQYPSRAGEIEEGKSGRVAGDFCLTLPRQVAYLHVLGRGSGGQPARGSIWINRRGLHAASLV